MCEPGRDEDEEAPLARVHSCTLCTSCRCARARSRRSRATPLQRRQNCFSRCLLARLSSSCSSICTTFLPANLPALTPPARQLPIATRRWCIVHSAAGRLLAAAASRSRCPLFARAVVPPPPPAAAGLACCLACLSQAQSSKRQIHAPATVAKPAAACKKVSSISSSRWYLHSTALQLQYSKSSHPG